MSWLNEYIPLDGVRLNMVATQSGDFVGKNGSSRDISNASDRELIVLLRALSDIYVTGGNTFRSEGYKVPTTGRLAVITRTPLLLPDGVVDLDLDSALSTLSAKGFSRILLEVGPQLANYFLSRNLVDEFCLTIPGGSVDDAYRVVEKLGGHLTLAKQARIENTLFTQWRRGNE